MEVTEKLTVSDKKVEELTETVKGQQKTITDTAELLRDLMVNIENLGDNMKNLQEEVAHWRQPEVEDAEMELQDLVKETDLNPARAGPPVFPKKIWHQGQISLTVL